MKWDNLFYKVIVIMICWVGCVVFALADHEGPAQNPPNPPRDPKRDCEQDVGSAASLCDGTLRVDYTLPSYRSLGLDRTLRFVYNSTAADIRPIITFDAKPDPNASNFSARLFVNGQQQGNEVFYQTGSSLFRGALRFDASSLATGAYPYFVSLSNNYTNGTPQKNAVIGKVLVNNQRNSPFGAGWALDGLQRLVLNTTRDKNSALLVEGDGSTKVFSFAPVLSPLFDTVRNIDLQGQPAPQPVSVASGDFNGDSIPDLAVANFSSNNVSILLGNGDGTFQAPVNYPVGMSPKSITVGDFNGDGKPDLAVANNGSSNVSILLNNGNGTFPAAQNYNVGQSPIAITAGKFRTGNNTLDLAVANNGSNNVSILLGNGNGTFQIGQTVSTGTSPKSIVAGVFNAAGKQDLAVGHDTNPVTVRILNGRGDGNFDVGFSITLNQNDTNPVSLAVGDFNGDTKQDLAVLYVRLAGGGTESRCRFYMGNGDGTFNTANPLSLLAGGVDRDPAAVMVSDFNGDQIPDVAVISGSVLIWLGNGDGTFSTTVIPVAAFSNAGTIADFNGDGNLDIAMVSSQTHFSRVDAVSMLLGNGDGTFMASSFQTGNQPRSIAVSDFNGDGNLDLAVVNQEGTLTVTLGNGDGTFQMAQPLTLPNGSSPRTVAVGDFNNDGIQDLAVTNSGLNSISILLGNGDGTFQAPQSFAVGTGPVFVAAGDFNRDGLPDLAVSNWGFSADGTTISILINTTPPGGSLSFSSSLVTVGTGPNPIAIGDFNGDGCPDLAVANQGSGTLSILLGNRNISAQCLGTFPEVRAWHEEEAENKRFRSDLGGVLLLTYRKYRKY